MYKSAPLMIVHSNFRRKDNFLDIAKRVVKVCHMDRGEAALLLFYASCSSGFKPSLALIQEKCGVSKTYINALRQRLINKGIAAIIGRELVFDWHRLKIIAALDPAKTDKNGWINPISPIGLDRIGRFMDKWPSVLDMYTLPLADLIERLGAMPEYVYNAWRAHVNRQLKTRGVNHINEILH